MSDASLKLPARDPPSTLASGSASAAAGSVAAARPRLAAVDLLRGLVMILMALDHTRDFFGSGGPNPRDVTDPALFLTRWITHFCAPTFIFLAGLSAYLYGERGRSVGEISRFLFTRGLFLILIEFTLVRLGWSFDPGTRFFGLQVIWAIGAAMVVLAGLIHLPRRALAVLAVGMITGHNLFDGVKAAELGWAGPIWKILHEPGFVHASESARLFVLYPLVPWIGVMAAGYALGPVMKLAPDGRRRWLFGLGAALTAGFVLLRALNFYGDPTPWVVQDSWSATILSFLNCEKYPPSLLYLMMTLGPALMFLAAFEKIGGWAIRWLEIFGRVPLFFYVAHLFLIHALAVAYVFTSSELLGSGAGAQGGGPGLGLAGVYVVWVVVIAILYPICRGFAELKQRRTGWWWSYL